MCILSKHNLTSVNVNSSFCSLKCDRNPISKSNRRKFLQFAGGLTITAVTAANRSTLGAIEIAEPEIELRAWNHSGQPLEKTVFDRLYFLDLDDEPIPDPPRRVEAGRLFSQPPPSPFEIALRMPVQGFGEVTLYADNEGRGYSPADFPLDLNLACARSRLHRVRKALSTWNRAGIKFFPTIEARVQRAEAHLRAAEATEAVALRVKWCNQSLSESLWAGEEAVFAKAQQEINRQEPRPNFFFGCNFFGHPNAGSKYDQLFKQLFNFATVPFYWRSFEPQPDRKNFATVDAMVNWLHRARITPKGHPLVWFHEVGIPNWLRDKSYREIQQLTYQRVSEITAYYGAKIPYYDIINEANGIAWANELDYSPEQFLELTRLAAQASRAGNPQVTRIINNCCLWAENVAYHQPPQRSPYQYLKACVAANIPFEVIGLQLYYPNQDMFEINRLLDRFSRFGKPIHITELGVSSATELDEQAYLKEPRGLWHEPWSEKVQADWVEQFYTLCYSKPYIQAISWWDLADRGNFWPHGGLLHEDMQPKQAFYRLTHLIRRWRLRISRDGFF